MNKKIRRIAGILAGVMILSMLVGCSQNGTVVSSKLDSLEPMEAEEVYTYSFDIIGGKDVMPIGGYYGPSESAMSVNGQTAPTSITEEWYKAVAEAGINYIPYPQVAYNAKPEQYLKMLDLAQKYGIAQVVKDDILMGTYDMTKEDVTDELKDILNHPAFAGVFLYDEPGNPGHHSYRTNLSVLANASNVLNNDMGLFVYNNALYGSTKQLSVYPDYIKEYLETQGMKFFSYTCYPSFARDQINEYYEYFWTLAFNREMCEEYKMPFWSFIGAGAQWNGTGAYVKYEDYYPVEGEFDWNINTKLAFGVKGLHYFVLNQPKEYAVGEGEGLFDFQVNGMFGLWNNKNRWYYYAKDINAHIGEIDHVLMNSKNKGVIVSGNKAADAMKLIKTENKVDPSVIMDGTSWRELKDVSGDAIVGCFNYQGKTALYVVNYLFDHAQKIDLEFTGKYKMTVVQDAETSYLVGDSMTLDMKAGDGVLIVFD